MAKGASGLGAFAQGLAGGLRTASDLKSARARRKYMDERSALLVEQRGERDTARTAQTRLQDIDTGYGQREAIPLAGQAQMSGEQAAAVQEPGVGTTGSNGEILAEVRKTLAGITDPALRQQTQMALGAKISEVATPFIAHAGAALANKDPEGAAAALNSLAKWAGSDAVHTFTVNKSGEIVDGQGNPVNSATLRKSLALIKSDPEKAMEVMAGEEIRRSQEALTARQEGRADKQVEISQQLANYEGVRVDLAGEKLALDAELGRGQLALSGEIHELNATNVYATIFDRREAFSEMTSQFGKTLEFKKDVFEKEFKQAQEDLKSITPLRSAQAQYYTAKAAESAATAKALGTSGSGWTKASDLNTAIDKTYTRIMNDESLMQDPEAASAIGNMAMTAVSEHAPQDQGMAAEGAKMVYRLQQGDSTAAEAIRSAGIDKSTGRAWITLVDGGELPISDAAFSSIKEVTREIELAYFNQQEAEGQAIMNSIAGGLGPAEQATDSMPQRAAPGYGQVAEGAIEGYKKVWSGAADAARYTGEALTGTGRFKKDKKP